jgi:zinc protease
MIAKLVRLSVVALSLAAAIPLAVSPAAATKIQRIVSPGGVEAWLVREPSVPLVAVDFAFRSGSSQDPADKAGVASLVAALLDEGAGDLDSQAFHRRLEEKGVELSYTATRDNISGSFKTLTANKADAFELLRLSLTAPRFDADAVERSRDQTLALLRRQTTSPNEIASERWWAEAFPGHPYGKPVRGTLESVAAITGDDIKAYARKGLARDNLKVGIVGNIDAAEASAMLDRVFGGLPAKAELTPVAPAAPQGLGRRVAVDLDVPQSILVVGGAGIARKDPDFMAAFIVNHILGGGSFSSRLYREVREQRGLVYSVYSTLVPLDHAALFMSSTATGADRTGQTLDVLIEQVARLAATGPTEDELTKAKSYLKGSYALRFDTSTKIAAQLVAIQLDELGIDYIDKRNGLVEAVTLADVKRVAKRLLEGNLLVTVVGRPQSQPAQALPAKKGEPG